MDIRANPLRISSMKNLLSIIALAGLVFGCAQSSEKAGGPSEISETGVAESPQNTQNKGNSNENTTKSLEVTHVDAEQAAQLLKDQPEVVVLDVRTPEEFQSGHLAEAENIDFRAADFEANLSKLDREQPYLVHCRSGRRSESSLAFFKKLGFKKVYHLDGGILAWTEAGNETVK